MHARLLSRGDDTLCIRVAFKLGDVFGDRAVEKPDVLRQIADDLSQPFGAVLIQCRTRQPDIARCRAHKADDGARQRRLARPAAADNADSLAWGQIQRDLLQNRRLAGARDDRQRTNVQLRRGRRQFGPFGAALCGFQQFLDSGPAGARPLHDLPLRNALLDRCQRPAQKDRGCDHRARRDIALKHEPGADGQNGGLQKQPKRLGERPERAGPVVGFQRLLDRLVLGRDPAVRRSLRHALRPYQLAAFLGLPRESVGKPAQPHAFGGLFGRQKLIEDRNRDQDRATHQRQPAKKRVKDEDRCHEKRRPGHVEQRQHHRRRKKPAHRIEILKRSRRRAPMQRSALENRTKYRLVQLRLKAGARARHDAAAGVFQKPEKEIQNCHKREERDQRFLGTRAQHPVIDLKHEQRPGQHQQIGENAEYESGRYQPAKPGIAGSINRSVFHSFKYHRPSNEPIIADLPASDR